ncbi:hypothetical protein DFH27DRAFT_521990 [Peziza echinospora]|nr:hypothetical protein DFH27DRAFT_521990 [Peziza echinospora]
MTSPEHRTSRPLDVNNILNPTPQRSLDGSRRRSAAHFDSPRSSSMAHLQNTARSLPPSPVDAADAAESSKRRHIAQPSRQHRPNSLGGGIMGQQQHPYGFAARRFSAYSAENIQQSPSHPNPTPASNPPATAPPPVSASGPQSGYPFPTTPGPHGYQQQQQSHQQQQSQQSYQQPASTSVSPTTSYSSYVPPGHSNHPSATTPTSYHSQQYGNHPLSPYSHSHGHFPMMALATAHGSIPVSVDTTAASKSADEKRKRNAGASARFRQRRKEREREMTQRITDLEQRLKKAEDERDYYRDMYVRIPPPGRPQQALPPPQSAPPPPPPPHPQSSQHPTQHPAQQYAHPPPPRLDTAPYGHNVSHSSTSPYPGSYSANVQRESAVPGYQAQPSAYHQRRDSTAVSNSVQRRESERYEDHGRHH